MNPRRLLITFCLTTCALGSILARQLPILRNEQVPVQPVYGGAMPIPMPRRVARPTEDITLSLTSTSRQIIVSYTAPSTSPCTIEVSESNTYSPVVPDVNTSLFSGSNSDDRAGSLGVGSTTHVMVIGHFQQPNGVTPLVAGDTNTYPRVLQVNTTHYVRVTCGSHTGVASIATKNRPIGMTYAEPMPMTAAGVYGIPTLDSSSRSETTLDPQFGTLLRKVSINGDNSWSGVGSMEFTENGAEWPFTMDPGNATTINDSSATAGYLSQLLTTDGFTRLYWTNTASTSGVSRHLGYVVMTGGGGVTHFSSSRYAHALSSLSSSDPRKIYNIFLDDDDNARVVQCLLPASGNSYYDQSVPADGTTATCTWSDLTAAESLSAKLVAFDAAYDKTKFNSFFYQYVVGDYILFAIGRGTQNSYVWGGAYRISTNAVVALSPLYQQAGNGTTSNQRFCGFHTVQPIPGKIYLAYENHDLVDASGTGTGGSAGYVTSLTGAINNSVTSITLASNTPISAEADTSLGAFAAGDEIRIDLEIMYLVENTSGTTWTVTRGEAGTSAVSHLDAASVRAGCRCHAPSDFTNAAIMTWNVLADPTGVDATNTDLVAFNDGVNGHQSSSFSYKIGSGWKGCNYGSDPTPCSPTLTFSQAPTFGGVSKDFGGNAGMTHPAAPHQINASAGQVEQGVDFIHSYLDPDTTPTSVTSVTGTLFKLVLPVTLDTKTLPIVAFAGLHPLLNISSVTTGNVIVGTSGDNYKICVAYKVNECRTGSSVGDIYVNAPAVTTGSVCSYFISPTDSTNSDLCVFNGPGTGAQNLIEIGLTAGYTNGKYLRALTHGLAPYKMIGAFANGQTSPDGNWIFFHAYSIGSSFGNVWAVKRPPFPTYDSIDRNDFITNTVAVAALPGATKAYIRFGYNPSYYCKERSEVCAMGAGGSPYAWESSDTLSATSCASGCNIGLKVLPDYLGYGQVVYLDNSNVVVGVGNPFVITDASAAISGGSVVVASGGVPIGGKITIGGRITIQQ